MLMFKQFKSVLKLFRSRMKVDLCRQWLLNKNVEDSSKGNHCVRLISCEVLFPWLVIYPLHYLKAKVE